MTKQKPLTRTVLVTGAAKRIGRELVVAFANEGYSTILHYHTSKSSAESLHEELKRLHPSGLHRLVSGDLTEASVVEGLFDELSATGGLPSVVLNNASCYRRCPLGEETSRSLQEQLSVNFLAPFSVMRCYHERCQSGHIINMLDYRVSQPDPASGGYALAKKSLRDATEACAWEWAPDFRVNAIAPGLVISPPGVPPERLQRLLERIPLRRRTTEEELARAALFLEQTPGITGLTLYLDGGLHLLGANHTGERTHSCN